MPKRIEEEPLPRADWITVERLSGREEQLQKIWNREYGEGNWRLAWELTNGEVLDFESMFWTVYVAGYAQHFWLHPDQANFITQNYAYTYAKEKVNKAAAFNLQLLQQNEVPRHFHHLALNVALEWFLALPFQGRRPLKVQEGKPGSALEKQPEGYQWSPSRIAATRPELIPQSELDEVWWQRGSLEDLFQSAKVFQVRNR